MAALTRKARWLGLLAAAVGVGAYFLATSLAGSATGAVSGIDYFSIAGGSMAPGQNTCTFSHDHYTGDLHDTNACYYVGEVSLPSGAKVTQVLVVGEHGTGSARIHLERTDVFGDHDDLVTFEPFDTNACTADPCTATINTIDFPVVDNVNFKYGLWVSSNTPGFTFYGARIKYLRGPFASIASDTAVVRASSQTKGN